jgi:hypothetical protein
MEIFWTIVVMLTLATAGTWLYRRGYRVGSRRGFNAGRHNRGRKR